MELKRMTPTEAVHDALRILEKKTRGYGGIIALNPHGEVGIAFNTPRMARAYQLSSMRTPVVEA
jgi:isoaspartyl peptidase/L-asparaginase-like protein (Ntn-hydrolase superfamily)